MLPVPTTPMFMTAALLDGRSKSGGTLRGAPRSSKPAVVTSEINELELRRVDLNLMLVFSALMRTRRVRAAAGRLFLGPSAVSMALNRLRKHFGDPLFIRTPSGMEPTALARALDARVVPALAEIGDAVLRRPAFDPSSARRTFRFSSPDGWKSCSCRGSRPGLRPRRLTST